MQDTKDPRAFTIVERYLHESSQKYVPSPYRSHSPSKSRLTIRRYHLENPYWQTFDKYVIPLLDRDMDLRRLNELDTSQPVQVEQDAELWDKVKAHQK